MDDTQLPTTGLSTIAVFPPDEGSRELLGRSAGGRVTHGIMTALDGPAAGGPETAGALSVVYSAFADDAGAQRGYRNFAAIKQHLQPAPGMVRWLTFADGPHVYALGFWRSVQDVAAFTVGPAHAAMVREQRENPFEYTQFAGVWTAHALGRRNLYCPGCRAATPAPARRCTICGDPLQDPFDEA
jgi:heme-degrading monooxygenase HmoA